MFQSNAIASAYSIKQGHLVDLSAQQILDCTFSGEYGNYGCDGGFLESTFLYTNNVGLVSDTSYPYTGKVNHVD